MTSVISASLHSAQFLKDRLALASSFTGPSGNALSQKVTKFNSLNSKCLQQMPTWRASQPSGSSETDTNSVADVEVTPYEVLDSPLSGEVVKSPNPWTTEEGEPSRYEKLFSNLNEATFQHEPGSLINAILLIAGTTVGAGILAIPTVTQEAGFLASSITCMLCWLYMVTTGLLVAEVNVSTMCELGSGGVSLVSMAKRTLGRPGVLAACVAYLFIHYALLVAYTARSSDILTSMLGTPQWLSATIFSGAFGSLCYFGSQRVIGAVNGVLVAGIIGSFVVLVFGATGSLHWSSLLKANFTAVPQSIPIIALSFVYQNVVPVVCTSLEGDLPKIRSAVVLGTAMPLMMFLVWDAVILGSLSGISAISETQMTDPLMELRSANGIVGPTIEVFSLLAITTSYIGFVLGLTDFLSDLLQLPVKRGRQIVPYLLSVFPPVVLALLDPEIFFKALDFAGTYGVLVLFGILPASMAWAERYADVCLPPPFPPLVPGGKVVLVTVIGTAGYIISSELISSLVFSK